MPSRARLSAYIQPMPNCSRCDDQGRVCETHRDMKQIGKIAAVAAGIYLSVAFVASYFRYACPSGGL
jgi:hypothetical protein